MLPEPVLEIDSLLQRSPAGSKMCRWIASDSIRSVFGYGEGDAGHGVSAGAQGNEWSVD